MASIHDVVQMILSGKGRSAGVLVVFYDIAGYWLCVCVYQRCARTLISEQLNQWIPIIRVDEFQESFLGNMTVETQLEETRIVCPAPGRPRPGVAG